MGHVETPRLMVHEAESKPRFVSRSEGQKKQIRRCKPWFPPALESRPFRPEPLHTNPAESLRLIVIVRRQPPVEAD